MKFAIALIAGAVSVALVQAGRAHQSHDSSYPGLLRSLISTVREGLEASVHELSQQGVQTLDTLLQVGQNKKADAQETVGHLVNNANKTYRQFFADLRKHAHAANHSLTAVAAAKIHEYRQKSERILHRFAELVQNETETVTEEVKNEIEKEKQALRDELEHINKETSKIFNDELNRKRSKPSCKTSSDVNAESDESKSHNKHSVIITQAEKKFDAIFVTFKDAFEGKAHNDSSGNTHEDNHLVVLIKNCRHQFDAKLQKLNEVEKKVEAARQEAKKELNEIYDELKLQLQDLKVKTIELLKKELTKLE